MKKPDIPANEEARLLTLKSLDILDTEYEDVFDRFVKIASDVCETKISAISLVDQDRQWFKAQIGLNVPEISRDISFCGHAILESELFEIQDAKNDERFKDNPLVINDPNIQFYAGAQIKSEDGYNIGMLCVLDEKPKKLNENQKNILKILADQVMQMISLRKKYRQSMQEAARVDMIVTFTGVGTWDWDLTTNAVRFDNGWCEMLGFAPSELENRLETWDNLCHPDDKKSAYRDIAQYLEGKTSIYENVHRLRHKNGEWIYILDRGKIIQRDTQGKPLRFAGTHTNITGQKRVELIQGHITKLREIYIKNQNDKKSFFEFLLSEVISLTESEYGFVGEIKRGIDGVPYLKTYSITDISWNEEIKIFFDKHAPQGLEFKNLDTLFGKVIKSGELLITNEASSHPDAFGIPKGHPPLNKFMGVPIYGHGKFIAMIGVANSSKDFSETKYNELKPYFEVVGELIHNHLLDQELKIQQNDAHHEAKLVSLGVLAAGIGHEINNPLTIIHGNLDRLSKRIMRKEIDEEFLLKTHGEMLKALVRVENLIKGLRTFSRKDTLQISPMAFLGLIDETVNMLFQIYKADGITIKKNINLNENTKILADRGKIQQILINLMNNSRDSIINKDNGKIIISAYENNDKAILSISDNGPGIPKEIQDKIFDPFFTTKEVNKGTGLGLSIVADIVRLHGAKLTFESSGSGTTFYIEFAKV